MLSLLKIEWLKIRYYKAFWWVSGIIALAYPAVGYCMVMMYRKFTEQLPPGTKLALLGNPFGFKEVWHTIGYFSSFFVFIPAIVVIMLITNEYSFRTNRQNIIDGWSRTQFLTGKLMDVSIISILITILYVATCVLIGFTNSLPGENSGDSKQYFIGYFLLQTFSQLSIAFLLGMLVKKAFIALAIFIPWFLIFENILTSMLSFITGKAGHFLPFEISDRMIPPPEFAGKIDPVGYAASMNEAGHHFVYTLVFTVLLWIGCFRLNAKRDL